MANLHRWGEAYLYAPSLAQRLLSTFLLPVSWLYCLVMFVRYRTKQPQTYGIPVVSVGNLTVGGSGKTPVVVALSRHFVKPAIVLRGYGRQSKGLIIVADQGQVQCDVTQSGDEAMIYAQQCHNAVVIVSECRKSGIVLAQQMGCDLVLLDDGYSKHGIAKLDLVIDVKTKNSACLPSGPFRERLWHGKKVTLLHEGIDFERHVTLDNPTQKMVLVTAIARPERLDAYLPAVVAKYYFDDHYFFSSEELEAILAKHDATSLLVTYKDYVKIAQFNLPLSLMDLDVSLDTNVVQTVTRYVEQGTV